MGFKIKLSAILTVIIFILNSTVIFSETVIQTSDGDVTYTDSEKPVITTNAKSAVLIDAESGEILYEENKDERLAFASITKIMTMLLTMESIESGNLSYDQKLVCSEHAKSMGGSEIWLEVGEEMTVSDLLKAVAVNSANDAAVVLAEAVGGTEDNFVDMMNKKAAALGMVNTCFKNTNGLPEEGHYSTAYDIALMSMELLKHDKILNYTTIWTDTLRNGETALSNTNKLIRFYKGATGLKTGYTDDAGYCLSASAERNGLKLVGVVLGCETSDKRFEGIKELLNYGFSAYTYVTPRFDASAILPVKVLLGTKEQAEISIPEIKGVAVKKENKDKITSEIQLSENVMAPVDKGQTLGTLTFTVDGKLLAKYNLTASEDIPKLSFSNSFCALFLKFLFMK